MVVKMQDERDVATQSYIVEAGEIFEIMLRRLFVTDRAVVFQELHDEGRLRVPVHEHFLIIRNLPQYTHVFVRLGKHHYDRSAEKFPANW